MMNLTKLKYFHAICTFHSFSEAAEYLHIAQPSLSNAIKELENEYGVSLFSRHYRGVSLTSEGQVLYNLSKDVLNRTEQAENIMKELGTGRKKLRLGVPPMIGSMILPRIYGDFLSLNKDLELEIVEGGRQDLVYKLSKDYLDMVFLSHDVPVDSGFSSLLVSQLEITCCTFKDNYITSCDSITPTMLKDIPLVLFENSFFQTAKIKSWFESAQVTPNIILQTTQLSTMLSMISSNLAVGFMFRELIDTNPALLPIPTAEPMYANVSLVWKKDAFFSNSMNKFKQYVKQTNLFNSNM